jgi:hypothetical protein
MHAAVFFACGSPRKAVAGRSGNAARVAGIKDAPVAINTRSAGTSELMRSTVAAISGKL